MACEITYTKRVVTLNNTYKKLSYDNFKIIIIAAKPWFYASS